MDEPRKPQWFPPPRALPHPRNLPPAPLIKPEAPKPAPVQKAKSWRLPWPPAEAVYFARRGGLTASGEQYIQSVANIVRRELVEYAAPVRLTVAYYPPTGVTLLDPYIAPVRHALLSCGVWAAADLVREQRYHFATDARSRGPVRVTVAPIEL